MFMALKKASASRPSVTSQSSRKASTIDKKDESPKSGRWRKTSDWGGDLKKNNIVKSPINILIFDTQFALCRKKIEMGKCLFKMLN